MDEFLWRTGDDRLVITARGETDPAATRVLHPRLVVLADAATGRIELDPSQVGFVDCAGSRTLAAVHRMATVRGGSMRMASVSPVAARLFELAGPRGTVPRIIPLSASPATAPGSSTSPIAQTSADLTAPAVFGWRFVGRWRSSVRRHRTAAPGRRVGV